jgi:regulation of enolase protein 1 (concanavalin A-like superfamily)
MHLGFGTDRSMAIDGNVIGNLVLGGTYKSSNSDSGTSFVDDFSGQALNPRWHWAREDPTHWSLSAAPGFLRITTQQKDISGTENTAPLLLQSLAPYASQDFNLQTRVTITPTANSQQAGLIVYGDDDNYVKLTHGYLEGPTFDFTQEVAGAVQSIRVPAPKNANTFYLRILKLAKNYYAYYSANGSDWTVIGTHPNVNIPPLEVGLLAFNGAGETNAEIPADFDSFRIDTRLPAFSDVSSTHPYYPDIEILFANNLTGGCQVTPLKFCPDMIMDRAQSAAFLMRGTYGSAYDPAPSENLFEDDWSPGTWARPWAEAMREAGMTAGCKTSPLLYCPWVPLPREQVVIFALRMKYGDSYKPPAATGAVFADMTDPNYYATAWAEQAYKEGIIPDCGTSGGKPRICPKTMVSRGLAAYMIVRAKSLTMP